MVVNDDSKKMNLAIDLIMKALGIMLFFPIWLFADNKSIDIDISLRGTLVILALGVSYCLFNSKSYPVKFIAAVITVAYIAYRLTVKDFFYAGGTIYSLNLYIGFVLVIAGVYVERLFSYILTPVKNFLRRVVNSNIPIPILAAILFVFPFCFAAPEVIDWWEDYQLFQRNPDIFDNKSPKPPFH